MWVVAFLFYSVVRGYVTGWTKKGFIFTCFFFVFFCFFFQSGCTRLIINYYITNKSGVTHSYRLDGPKRADTEVKRLIFFLLSHVDLRHFRRFLLLLLAAKEFSSCLDKISGSATFPKVTMVELLLEKTRRDKKRLPPCSTSANRPTIVNVVPYF